jgi:hypothetical protein
MDEKAGLHGKYSARARQAVFQHVVPLALTVRENRPFNLERRRARNISLPAGEIGQTAQVRRSSKHGLDDAKDQLLQRKNREQERQERSCGGGGQTGDILESEGDRTHFAHKGIAVAEIGERLNIGSSEKFVGTGRTGGRPISVRSSRHSVGQAGRTRPIPFFLREPFGE